MPAREFLDGFQHDPTTFDFDQFKARLNAELAGDDDLRTASVAALTEERDRLAAQERDLKVRLFDATIGKQGDPVVPNNSPARAGDTAPEAVPETDIFEKVV